jgi:hypothetical protein
MGGSQPDWYRAMRACRYAGTDFCKAYGIRYSVFVEQWALIAESAEIEAQNTANERAAKGD